LGKQSQFDTSEWQKQIVFDNLNYDHILESITRVDKLIKSSTNPTLIIELKGIKKTLWLALRTQFKLLLMKQEYLDQLKGVKNESKI
jgi:hypothetical protein